MFVSFICFFYVDIVSETKDAWCMLIMLKTPMEQYLIKLG